MRLLKGTEEIMSSGTPKSDLTPQLAAAGEAEDQRQVEYWRLLLTTEEKLSFEFDRKLTWLSGGALALSMTFLKDIVAVVAADAIVLPGLIIAAWVGFLAVLGMALVNNYIAIQAWREKRKGLGAEQSEDQRKERDRYWELRIQALNVLNIVGILVSIGLLVLFTVFNI